ncbi:MAG: hypothetical protein PHD21_03350 [Flavobacteriales bacterium]|nr:hypothetical protein [Flavobacteriales bacterium]
MNKNTLRLVLSLLGLILVIYGFFSGRLGDSFEKTPVSTGFIVVVLVGYAVVNTWMFLSKKKK